MVEESLPQSAEWFFHLSENLEPEIFYQLTKVLRVKADDKIVFLPALANKPFASHFFEYIYAVSETQKKDVVLHFEKKVLNENEPDYELGLILCLPNKPDKLEFILQKAVELGTGKIILVKGDFSQMKHELRPERLQKIIVEAAEQAERAIIPKLSINAKLSDFLKNVSTDERKKILVAMERSDQNVPLRKPGSTPLGTGVRSDRAVRARTNTDVQILIGPEGGFSSEEKELFKELGLQSFSLGKRILRMETAAILALGMATLFSNCNSAPALSRIASH